MPARYSIKRNSLSSKWGVWSTGTQEGGSAPIESLVVELKTQEAAETYCERAETGESHDAIMASLSDRKPRGEGGGLFGKLFKKGSSKPEQPAAISNPVIEIDTPRAADKDAIEEVAGEPVPTPEPVRSKFELIEQPTVKAPEQPVKQEVAVPDEVSNDPTSDQVEPASTDLENVSASTPLESLPESVETAAATGPEVQQSEIASPVDNNKADKNGVLVNWTFTPPPDVTPEELRSSGESTGSEAISGAPQTEESEVREKISPITRNQAKVSDGPVAERPEAVIDNSGSRSDQVSVEISISKALQEVTVGDPRVSDKKYNSVASKEYTEVNKAFTSGMSPDYLREELMHLAAVCLSWADAIGKRQAEKSDETAA